MASSPTGSRRSDPAVPTERIRNVVLVGHGGVGKTSLADALLARSGAVPRAGSVDAGTSALDTDPESTARHMSLSMALAPFTWTTPDGQVHRVNLIDTPGYDEFVAEVECALDVADLALVVMSAVDGVQRHTERLWRLLDERAMPRLVVVNKDDAERADFDGVLAQMRSTLAASFVPIEVPLGERRSLHGVADLMSEQAFEAADGSRNGAPLPADVIERVHSLHDAVVDDIVAGDDEQLERYLSGEMPSVADLERVLSGEMITSRRVPVLVGSAATGVGLDRMADLLCELGPSPRPVDVLVDGEPVSLNADPAAPTLLRVVATRSDPFVGQISIVRVLAGTVTADQHLVNQRSGADERLHGLARLCGVRQEPVDRAVAGDVVAVTKLRDTHTGDVLAPGPSPRIVVPHRERRAPMHSVAVEPRTEADDDKLSQALQRLVAEDPALRVSRDDGTHQTLLSGAGEMHVAVAVERLARKFGVTVDVADVEVPFLETVIGTAEAEGKVKKQSGGHGQYAVVNLRVSPLPRGSGIEFVDSVVGGAIPRPFITAVHKGVIDAANEAGVHGHRVVDVRVECYDGKFHAVDSSDMAFRAAAAQALRAAMAAAGVRLLEPVSLVTVTAPADLQGAILGDITRRRGRVQSSEPSADGEHEIRAHVPTVELLHYAAELRSLTGGRGRFTAVYDHHDVAPADVGRATSSG